MSHNQQVHNQGSWRTSRYNFAFAVDDGVLLYNANSGAALLLLGRHGAALGEVLCCWPMEIEGFQLPGDTLRDLCRGGFLIGTSWDDEVASIRRRFQDARQNTPLVLTITTTMDCNLACYYCYEERSPDRLTRGDIPAIVDLAEKRLHSGKHSLHVDWYGGEPTLNLHFLEEASAALQELCHRLQVRYAASIISNGTSWPADVEEFVASHAIRQVQISFDGMERNHNRRRRYRQGHASDESSFDRAVALVDRLLNVVRVDIRLNIDRKNQTDVAPFIQFVRSKGWFEREFPAVIQPARLASYSDYSSFMRACELSVDDFDAVRAIVRSEVDGVATVEESEAPSGYPHPRTSVCAAIADSSVVIGADAHLYRCGLQVGDVRRSVGDVSMGRDAKKQLLPIVTNNDSQWWANFDPTIQPKCSQCSFLPICWGGCPKKHLENDNHAIAEQGEFWRNNLARLVATKTGHELLGDGVIDESLQFRQSIG